MYFERGDFVKYKGEGWLITNVEEEEGTCELVNQYREEVWNVNLHTVEFLCRI